MKTTILSIPNTHPWHMPIRLAEDLAPYLGGESYDICDSNQGSEKSEGRVNQYNRFVQVGGNEWTWTVFRSSVDCCLVDGELFVMCYTCYTILWSPLDKTFNRGSTGVNWPQLDTQRLSQQFDESPVPDVGGCMQWSALQYHRLRWKRPKMVMGEPVVPKKWGDHNQMWWPRWLFLFEAL